MAVLGRFTKQSGDVLDYDVIYDEWFGNRVDAPDTHVVTAAAGITVVADYRVGNNVRIRLSGGSDGSSYKIQTALTTTSGAVKEAEFVVKIKDT